MSKSIWKFSIPISGDIDLVVPAGAEFLHVAVQDGYPHVWALVEVRQSYTEKRRLHVAMTGAEIPKDYRRYLGTFILGASQDFVGHLFELAP